MSTYVGKMQGVLVSFNNTALAIYGIKDQTPAAEPPKDVFGFDFKPLDGR